MTIWGYGRIVISVMSKKQSEGKTRQVFAAIDEGLYLAAKSQAAEMRVPLREIIEMALSQMLENGRTERPLTEEAPKREPSIWDDEYLRMQSRQPIGAPVQLAREEAARVARAAFGSASGDWSSGNGKRTDG